MALVVRQRADFLQNFQVPKRVLPNRMPQPEEWLLLPRRRVLVESDVSKSSQCILGCLSLTCYLHPETEVPVPCEREANPQDGPLIIHFSKVVSALPTFLQVTETTAVQN